VTERIYHHDPSCLDFDAVVVSCSDRGGRQELILDRTAFYPGGGGQPADRGTIGGAAVVELKEAGEEIAHLLDPAPQAHFPAEGSLAPGSRVHGTVDGAWRRDFMAQHTGQHILSQALLSVGGLETVSVHFGEETTTIEVSVDRAEVAVLAKAEALANEIIKENRPVRTHEVDPSEASRFPLRRTPPDAGRLRIVEVDSFDWAACGGVHVAATGEIFLVKIIGQEKIRGHARIHAVMGRRALTDYGRRIEWLQQLSRILTCGEPEMAARAAELVAADKEKTKELRRLRLEAAAIEADRALESAERRAGAVFVRRTFDAAGAEFLKAFVDRVISAPGRIAIAADTSADSFLWIAAHSLADGPDLGALVAPLLALADARGGGRGGRVQGSGKKVASLEQFLDAVAAAMPR
jgi:alanyl-tRNA synthetase